MVLEYRLDPTKQQIVIIANERESRPNVFGKARVNCPFDKGVEAMTPPTKLALPREKNWRTRVFDNAFAFLKRRGKFAPRKANSLFWTSPAFGDHEVIVESEEHGKLFQDFGEEQLQLVFDTYARTFKRLAATKGVKCVFLFKNHGLKGGASIEHEHAQIVSLPFVPPVLQAEVDASKKSGKCLFCDLLQKERRNLLAENDFFTAFCPSFSRFSFETWIASKDHERDFTRFSREESAAFMRLLRDCIARVYSVAKDYNVVFHNSPAGEDLHFHAEIYPRSSTLAGMELGAGIIVNQKTEQEAVAALKTALV